MANIKVQLDHPIFDGLPVTFKAPCDCTQVSGLSVQYIDGKSTATAVFAFADAHGNILAGTGNLFVAGAMVRVILDTAQNKAYIQNADTNSYLEERLRRAAPFNLLDNSDFRNPVNQRNEFIYDGYKNKYTIDRWKTYGKVNLKTTVGGLEFTNISPSSGANNLYQYFETGTIKDGQTYTAAMMLADGTLCVGSGKAKNGTTTKLFTSVDKSYGIQIAANYEQKDHFAIRNEIQNNALSILWVALYEGEYTAETLPKYQPKGYAVEYAECMRYFYRVSDYTAWVGYKSTTAYAFIQTAVHMRFIPTVTAEKFILRGTLDAETSGITTTINGVYDGHGNGYRLTFNESGLTAQQPLVLVTYKLELSADL